MLVCLPNITVDRFIDCTLWTPFNSFCGFIVCILYNFANSVDFSVLRFNITGDFVSGHDLYLNHVLWIPGYNTTKHGKVQVGVNTFAQYVYTDPSSQFSTHSIMLRSFSRLWGCDLVKDLISLFRFKRSTKHQISPFFSRQNADTSVLWVAPSAFPVGFCLNSWFFRQTRRHRFNGVAVRSIFFATSS